jgi:ubiquitin-protein ligase
MAQVQAQARALVRVAKDVEALREWAAQQGTSIEICKPGGGTDSSETISTLPLRIIVTLHGPKESLYEHGVYRVQCNLSAEYPMKPPALAFLTPIWHPNIEASCGSVCLDLLKTRWMPFIRLHDLFGTYLMQLLTCPEPDDPFNSQAAAMMSDTEVYNDYTKRHTLKHAVPGSHDVVLPTIVSVR